MIEIRLTWPEVMMAATVGIMRQVQNLKEERKDRYGCDPADGWTPHIEGCCAELAVAKATNQFWSGWVGNLKADDVGRLQVRRGAEHHHRLILHPEDADAKRFVSVTGLAPAFRIHGWIYAFDGKKQEFWADPQKTNRFAFWVPQSALQPIESLVSETQTGV